MTLRPRDIRLAIFDLDGTLVDAYPAIADSINHMMKKMGYPPVSLRTVKRSVGWGVDSLVSCFVREDQAKKALAIFRAHHDTRLRQNIRLLAGVRTLLPFLKKNGCVLAIASNRPSKFCHIILKALGIDGYFDHVICGDDVKRPKPHPDMIKVILHQSGIKPRHAFYAGDMTVDVQCGRAAGVFTVAVPTGSCTRAELKAARPDLLIDRISQVRKFFAVLCIFFASATTSHAAITAHLTNAHIAGARIAGVNIPNDVCTGTTAAPVIGGVCVGGSKYAGNYNNYKYMVTPGGCTDLTNPVCGGGIDGVFKRWANNSGTTAYSNTGARSESDGANNTKILTVDPPYYTDADAALYCNNMVFGGYTDWFLPAKDELDLLYVSKATLGGFSDAYYWSSTEIMYTAAACQNFLDGAQDGYDKVSNNINVRCIRKY